MIFAKVDVAAGVCPFLLETVSPCGRTGRVSPRVRAFGNFDCVGSASSGDLDGALAAAGSAVETAASGVYQRKSLGDPAKENSFQKKATNAVGACGKLSGLEDGLVGLGWDPKDADLLRKRFTGSLNQAAHVMQLLRSRMSDAHGAKPALESVVFDSLKLASILVSLMK